MEEQIPLLSSGHVVIWPVFPTMSSDRSNKFRTIFFSPRESIEFLDFAHTHICFLLMINRHCPFDRWHAACTIRHLIIICSKMYEQTNQQLPFCAGRRAEFGVAAAVEHDNACIRSSCTAAPDRTIDNRRPQ